MITHGSRAVGMFWSSSSVTLVVVVSRLTSMIGVAAVTLIVSEVPATDILMVSGVAARVATCTVSLVKALKPDSVALTA